MNLQCVVFFINSLSHASFFFSSFKAWLGHHLHCPRYLRKKKGKVGLCKNCMYFNTISACKKLGHLKSFLLNIRPQQNPHHAVNLRTRRFPATNTPVSYSPIPRLWKQIKVYKLASEVCNNLNTFNSVVIRIYYGEA
jgi:hypothetical protein